MRIRKNARLITSSSSSCSSFLICQLNRSPWDVDSFSLQSEQHEDEFGVSGGNNLAQVIPSSDSLPSVESMMELSFEYVEKTAPPPTPSPPQRMTPLENDFEERVKVREDEQIGGCRTNINNHNNGWKNIHPPLPPVPAVPKKRGRPKKSASIATTASTTTTTTAAVITTNHNSNSNSNPYEFYYYSGFGPSWSKRRGNKYTSINGNDGGNNVSNCCNGLTMNDVDDLPSSSASHVMGEDDRDDDDKRNSNSVIVMDRVLEGELDYIEDDFDDDDDEEEDQNGGVGGRGRRIRKPIKARSLKSLM